MQTAERKSFLRVAVASLIVIAVAGYFVFPKTKAGPKEKPQTLKADQSIAVLPFANIGNDPEQEYFSDGQWAAFADLANSQSNKEELLRLIRHLSRLLIEILKPPITRWFSQTTHLCWQFL